MNRFGKSGHNLLPRDSYPGLAHSSLFTRSNPQPPCVPCIALHDYHDMIFCNNNNQLTPPSPTATPPKTTTSYHALRFMIIMIIMIFCSNNDQLTPPSPTATQNHHFISCIAAHNYKNDNNCKSLPSIFQPPKGQIALYLPCQSVGRSVGWSVGVTINSFP